MAQDADDTLQKVLVLCARHCATESDLLPDISLSDAGLTSIGLIELLIELEEEFDVTFPTGLLVEDEPTSPAAITRAILELKAQP